MHAVKNLPKLRFPEFSGAWEEKRLGGLLDIASASRVHKEQWTKHGIPFFRTSDVIAEFNGTENSKAFISKDLYTELTKKTGRVEKNDVLVTGGGSIGIPYLIRSDKPLYFKDADLLWLKNNDRLNGYYLYTFFLTPAFRSYLRKITHTGTISHYTIEQAKATPIIIAKRLEQEKIVSFLTKVDNKTVQLAKKKQLLSDFKTGVMQQVFSQRIRFRQDDGTDFPDWEIKKLGEFCSFHRGASLSKSDLTKDGSQKCIHYGELFTRYHEVIDSVVSRTNISDGVIGKFGDILMPSSDVTPQGLGKASALLQANVLLGGDINVVRCKDNTAPQFLSYLLNYEKNKIIRLVTGTTVKHIYTKDLKTISLSLPTSTLEQRKIVDFLMDIDTKISQIDKQLDGAKQFKKGLLQQMFV